MESNPLILAPTAITIGRGVVIEKCSQGGVRVSRFSAEAKKGNTSSRE